VPEVESPLSGSHQSNAHLGWSGKPNLRLRFRRPELDAPFPYVRSIHAMVDDLARREGIPLLELSPPFHQHPKAGGDQLIYAIDEHWTPAGHRVAAAALLASPIFQPLRDAGASARHDTVLAGGRRLRRAGRGMIVVYAPGRLACPHTCTPLLNPDFRTPNEKGADIVKIRKRAASNSFLFLACRFIGQRTDIKHLRLLPR
jgi:hypothetical protein